MGEFDLQAPFPCLGALAEDFQDERGAIEHLGRPHLFEIALLNRRKLRIDDDDGGFERSCFGGNLFGLAAADQGGGGRVRQRHDILGNDIQPDGRGEAHRLGQSRIGIAPARSTPRLGLNVDDERGAQFFGAYAGSPVASVSCSCIGPSGMTVEIACL